MKIAIVGMSFRFPGTNAERYWPDLLGGRDLVTSVESARWAQETFRHPGKNHPGTSYTFAAGSIGDVSTFDAGFFGISPREAAQMDPQQQRLLLEMSWEAFENGGIKPSRVKGSRCGVFIGISSADYAYRFADDLGAIDSKVATGNTSSIAANRISYVFDLRGPSMALDTACSSSLVAFHQACQSIRSGESTLAIAGGVSLHLHPYGFIAFSKASMLSRRGKCSVFDAAGDGYVRSEGGGVFILKDYDQAIADGNHVLAVVAASAVNSDGKKSGLTVPSSQAQAELLVSAYASAGIDPADIDYVEAHGTGTAVGDPIETRALGEALARFRPKDQPLLIGSVKSNLGHLEAASGVAGLVKAVFCVQHRTVPATIHVETLNPNIPFGELNLRVTQKTTALKAAGRLIIGVNSFGFGGANAHVILESPPATVTQLHARKLKSRLDVPLPLLVSAKTPAALKVAARELSAHLRAHVDTSLYDIAWNTVYSRDWHEHRVLLYGATHRTLASALLHFVDGTESEVPIEAATALEAPGLVAFVYSGNGSQWEGMGRQLLEADPVFKAAVQAVDAIFMNLADFSLEDELAGRNGAGRYALTEVAQPALFAWQVGMTEMLRSQGLMPGMVTGHSVGEVAAAWASGALTLEQAVQVIYHRSQLQGKTRGEGQMTAVAMNEALAAQILEALNLNDPVVISGINSARGITLAGSTASLAEVEKALAERGITFKRLDLDYAFHSPAMNPIESGIYRAFAALVPGAQKIPFVSAVTGDQLSGTLLGAYYWWQNIRNPVQFEKATAAIRKMGAGVLIEIGPHPVLRTYLNDNIKDALPGRVLATGVRGDDSPRRVWSTVAQALLAGVPVDLKHHFPDAAPFVALPNYPWQRERHWQNVTSESANILNRHKVHPLLGYRLGPQKLVWENQVDLLLNPTLADHGVGEAIVFPATAFVELGLAAAMQWHGDKAAQAGGPAPADTMIELEELEIHSPLLIDADHAKVLRVEIDPADGAFTVKARVQHSGEAWVVHASGRVPKEPQGILFAAERAEPPARATDFDAGLHHQLTLAAGLNYGPAFQAVDAGWIEGDAVWARLAVPAAIGADISHSVLHPALLDCTLQLIIHAMRKQAALQFNVAYVPIKFGRLIFQSGKGLPVMARADLVRCSPHSLSAHFTLFDERGQVVAWVRDVRFRSVRLHGDAGDHIRFLNYAGVAQPNPLSPKALLPNFADNLQTALSAASRRLVKNSTLLPYTHEIEPLLDALCAAFALDAIRHIAEDGAFLSDARVEQLAADSPRSALLVTRLIAMLQEDEVLDRNENGWHFRESVEAPAPHDIWNALLADHPGYFAIFHAVGRAGLNLGRILDGSIVAESVLPQECTVGAMFAEALGASGKNAISQAMQSCATQGLARLGEGQRLRIVEISRGVPAFAGELLACIDAGRRDYVIATSSRKSKEDCELAAERLPGAAVHLFGAEADAAARFASDAMAGRFQFAILVNDFNCDEEAQQALDHALRMLEPNGTLAMLGTPSSRWLDLLFGATDHWWTHPASAKTAPVERTQQYWQQCLAERGLECKATILLSPEVATSPFMIIADVACGTPAILPAPATVGGVAADAAADATAADAVAAMAPRRPAWILLADEITAESGLVARLTRQIEAHGGQVLDAGTAWRAAPSSAESAGVTAVKDASVDVSSVDTTSVDTTSLAALIGDACKQHTTLAGIVHLYGLKPRNTRDQSADFLTRQVESQVQRCAIAAALVQACEITRTDTTCWLVTKGAGAAMLPGRKFQLADASDAPLWGLGRTLLNEPAHLSIRMIDMERGRNGDMPSDALVAALARELQAADEEQEVILTQSGERFVPRLRGLPRTLPPTARPPLSTTLRLCFQFPGQLRNLRWEAFPREFPKADEIEIEVAATGLNFRDVMYALGLLSDEAVENGFAGPTLGLECSGVVIAVGAEVDGFGLGDRVVAFGPSSFSNHVHTKALAVSRIPPGISFEAAATIPSTFFTAYYAIHHLARLREGERILIHGAAGGVGVAAIQLAKHFGAEIFATAGSDDKRDFLRLLGVDHIFDSRSLAFADEILAITQGEGVDVVLNSLAGEAINRNLRILKPFGRFLELGKRDFYENTRIGLRPFRNNIAYFGIDADQLMQEQPALTQALFGEVMALFDEGILHPLPYRLFEADEVVEAFRYMQQARQIGKIVVTYPHGIKAIHVPRPQPSPLHLAADATYLVTGGLGGFGLRTARWLVEKGARNLALISRSGPVDADAQAAIVELTARGVHVLATACDVTDRHALAGVLATIAQSMPPLRGVLHAAVVIEDSLVRNTHAAQIRKVFAPKILGALNLHLLTSALKLDFFVLYSSATTLFGNPGQGNYVAANAWLEALAAARRAAGMPALCVRWGAIEDAGFLARNTQIRDALQGRMGGSAIKSGDALDILEELMVTNRSDLGVLELDWKALSRFLPTAKSPKFSEMEADGGDDDSDGDHADDIQRLLAELSPEELVTTFKEMLKAEIGEILRMPADKIDDTRSVYDMGLDSLMGVELALAIESRFGIRLPVMALSDSPTIARLADKIIAQLRGAGKDEEATPAMELAAQVQQLAGQHEASVDTQAIERFAKEMEAGQALTARKMIH